MTRFYNPTEGDFEMKPMGLREILGTRRDLMDKIKGEEEETEEAEEDREEEDE